MNIVQTLIFAGGAALFAIFSYVTYSGHGVQGTEWISVGIAGGAIAATTLGLVYVYRDQ
ncbi:MAG: hypothetical protein WD875_15095 [Pirellulales bacterium]